MTVLAFGALADILGKSQLTVDDLPSTQALIEGLQTSFPQLKNMDYAIAVNKQMVTDDTTLPPGATVALLPPFSGG